MDVRREGGEKENRIGEGEEGLLDERKEREEGGVGGRRMEGNAVCRDR